MESLTKNMTAQFVGTNYSMTPEAFGLVCVTNGMDGAC